MHREADQDSLDLLRSLMSMHVTLVLIGVGIPASGLLREGHRPISTTTSPNTAGGSFADQAATQTQRRFDLVDLDPFGYDTPEAIAAWVAHLAGVETHLRLLAARLGMLPLASSTTASTAPSGARRSPPLVTVLRRGWYKACKWIRQDVGEGWVAAALAGGLTVMFAWRGGSDDR